MKIMDRKIFKIAVVVFCFYLSGCVSYLTPKLESVAQEDSILQIDTLGLESQEWKAAEVKLIFSTVKTKVDIELTGDLIFSRSLTNTYSRMERFYIKMSFVDQQRQVLSTVDITPVLSRFDTTPEKVKFQVRTPIPEGSEGIAFNYYGVFRGDEPGIGTTDIYYLPFN